MSVGLPGQAASPWAFGADDFGRRAEGFARLFGTPGFLIGQAIVVALWIAINVLAVTPMVCDIAAWPDFEDYEDGG